VATAFEQLFRQHMPGTLEDLERADAERCEAKERRRALFAPAVGFSFGFGSLPS
jgi:hypothetical protein